MTTKLLTRHFRYECVKNFIYSIANNNYYFYVGDNIPHTNGDLRSISDDVSDTAIFPNRQMLMGKRVAATDVAPVIRYVPWQPKLFTMYDQDDTGLPEKDFFCMVTEGSYVHVWKCLDNNNGANSSIQPSFAEGAEPELYQTSDGYRWKYMTSVSSSLVSKFGTTSYFPLYANAAVTAAAVGGRIDIIKIDEHLDGRTYGRKYNNYLDGVFKATDITINGDQRTFNISNNVLSTVNGYYTDCLLYITAGVGQGQYQTITDYIANSTGNIIRTENIFPLLPQNGSTYEIRPRVNVVGNGRETMNCVARALVNALSGNSIYRIEVLQTGLGYSNASANVLANAVVGLDLTDICILRPMISPAAGHGGSIFTELYCRDVEVAVSLVSNENNTIPTTNQFQQIGLIKNPLFDNVVFNIITPIGLFTSGEEIKVVNPSLLNLHVTANANSTSLSCNNANFLNQVAVGQNLILTTTGNSASQFVNVAGVSNSTMLTVSTTMKFSCAESMMYLANVSGNAFITSVVSSNKIVVSNCQPVMNTLSKIIGMQSGAMGTISTMERNEVTKGFDTFVQPYKYKGTLITGTFVQNEMVRQGSKQGFVYSTAGVTDITLYLTNMSQLFEPGTALIIGNTSGATATLTTRFEPEVIPRSGSIHYVENINPVQRANNQSELFQFIVDF